MCRLMVLLVFIFSNGQEYFNITRQPSSKEVDLPDVFRIPPSQCNESKGGEECTQMGGRKIGDCQCDCGSANKSTFGFYHGKWKCVNNSLFRKQAGCLQLSSEHDDDPIKTLSRNVMSATSSNSPHSETVLIVNNSSLLAADNSSYRDCEGKWKSFNGSRRFHQTQTSYGGYGVYGVKFNNESDRWEPRLEGRIIRVGVLSMNRSSMSCLLLKLDGHQICAEPPSSSSSSSSSSSAVATPTLSVPTPTSTSCGSECKTTPTPPSELHKMIIMVLIGGAILMVIIVALVLMKKISRRNTRRTTVAKETDVVQGQNGVGTHRVQRSLEDDQEEYSYAYASAVSITKRDVDHHPKNKESPIPVADYVNQDNSDFNISDELEYEIMSNTETDESKAIKPDEDVTKTLDSTTYCSLVGNVPHVYGSLKGPHNTHGDDTDRQVTCTSQNKENDTYQQLNTFGQQNHGEYQAPKYNKEKPVKGMTSRV